MHLLKKIGDRSARVGVVGLGYVGLPLAMAFAQNGFRVTGIDHDKKKVENLRKGFPGTELVQGETLTTLLKQGKFMAVEDPSCIKELDVIIICVPTPLNEHQEPDLSFIVDAVEKLKKYVRPGSLIVLESTTYPGTTEEVIANPLTEVGFHAGQNLYLCFSPERMDPGNQTYKVRNIPKVIGGITPQCLERGQALYSIICEQVCPVSSTKVAEMSKLLENTFRSVNIAFINEMAIMCDLMKVDVWEVIKASSTKPFGFMPFYPGPGIGGHCIPLDPMYLSWKARGVSFFSRFIEAAQEINKNMPKYVVSKVNEALNEGKKCVNGSRILLLGMSYKPDIGDYRESPGLDVYELLKSQGADVDVNEPHIQTFRSRNGREVRTTPLDYRSLDQYDCVVILTPHSVYDRYAILQNASLIVDTRNMLEGETTDKLYRIGKAGSPLKREEQEELMA